MGANPIVYKPFKPYWVQFMCYLATDPNGDEYIYLKEPVRQEVKDLQGNVVFEQWTCAGKSMKLPRGSIKVLIGKNLKYSDNPERI